VEIEHAFWIARREVTNEQQCRWRSPYSFLWDGPRAPARFLEEEMGEFCEWLSVRAGARVRPPTEEEWEYACRAGSSSAWCYGDDGDRLAEWATYRGSVERRDGTVVPTAVASRRANAWGLYDVHGNAFEWCADGCLRGGACWIGAEECRSASRVRRGDALWQCDIFGLRPVAEFP
jgi:formylglycine-generating enzyme required for sulfatase activity